MTSAPTPNGRRRLPRRHGPLRRAGVWLREVEKRDLSQIPSRPQRFAMKVAQVLLLVGRLDVVRQLQLHAQALTYDTMLALVPLLAVVFAVVSGFGGLQDLRHHLEELILNNISGSDEVRVAVQGYLRRVLGTLRSGSFSALSVVILVYSVLSLLGHIEFAINAVFGSKADRPWLSRLITYWAALTLGPLLLGASFALTAALQSSWVAGFVGNLGVGGLLIRLLPFVVTWIALTAMYVVVPTVHVKLSGAAFAGLVAGGLWTVAKVLYAMYAHRALSVQNIYGSVAAVPLFILWVYVSWLLVLLGAQLAFAYQHASTYEKDQLALQANAAYRERVACRAFLELSRDFYAGRGPTDPDELASNLDIPRRLLESVVHDLRKGGFVREVESDAVQGGCLIPARDLARVTVADIVTLFRSGLGVQLPMRDDEARRAIDSILDELDRDLVRHAGSVTFRDLAARTTDELPAPGDGASSLTPARAD